VVWNRKLTKTYLVKFESFKNEFSNLVTEDNYISKPYGLNSDRRLWLTEPIQYNQAKNYSNRGDGWSHGFELLLKKSNRPGTLEIGLVGSLILGPSRLEIIIFLKFLMETIQFAQQRKVVCYMRSIIILREGYASFDRTHIANLVYGWRFTEDQQIGTRWAYLNINSIGTD
jgi:hypothetical protein